MDQLYKDVVVYLSNYLSLIDQHMLRLANKHFYNIFSQPPFEFSLDKNTLIEDLIQYGGLSLLKKNKTKNYSPFYMELASKSLYGQDQMDMIQFLHSKGCPFDQYVIRSVTEHANLQLLEWIYKQMSTPRKHRNMRDQIFIILYQYCTKWHHLQILDWAKTRVKISRSHLTYIRSQAVYELCVHQWFNANYLYYLN